MLWEAVRAIEAKVPLTHQLDRFRSPETTTSALR